MLHFVFNYSQVLSKAWHDYLCKQFVFPAFRIEKRRNRFTNPESDLNEGRASFLQQNLIMYLIHCFEDD